MSKQILIVDDSPSIRQMISFTLRNGGYAASEAGDGGTALNQARASQFGLIITDVNMPGLDGFSFTQALRSLPRYGQTPILVLTTEASDAMKQQGRAAGATGWLVKPFDPKKLLELVQRLLG